MKKCWDKIPMIAEPIVVDICHFGSFLRNLHKILQNTRNKLVRDLWRIRFPFLAKCFAKNQILCFVSRMHATKGKETFHNPQTGKKNTKQIFQPALHPRPRSEQNNCRTDESKIDTSVTRMSYPRIWTMCDEFVFGTNGDLECEQWPQWLEAPFHKGSVLTESANYEIPPPETEYCSANDADTTRNQHPSVPRIRRKFTWSTTKRQGTGNKSAKII